MYIAGKSYRGFYLKGIIIVSFVVTVIMAYFSSTALLEELNVQITLDALFSKINNCWFLFIIPITLFNILSRYIRWAFLLRAFGVLIPSRELFSTYLISYTGNFFPFHIPYLIRLMPLKNYLYSGIFILILDLTIDTLSIMILFYGSNSYHYITSICLIILIFGILYLSLSHKLSKSSFWKQLISVVSAFAVTILIWFITSFSLFLSLESLGSEITIVQSLYIFTNSLYSSSISYIPAGIAITGASIIDGLESLNVPLDISIYAAIINRALTFWLVLLIAVLSFFYYIRLTKKNEKIKNHFDDISEDYEGIIPEYVEDLFVEKKMKINLEFFPQDQFRTGLDAGCGQGWYIRKMAGSGFDIFGIDYSAEQVEFAKNNTGFGEERIKQASITDLPFDDNTFDFAYAINIIHHLSSYEEQKQAFSEIHRVLKPGGRFIIHEMNILNPVFRFYLGYIFPIIKAIDEGTEMWIKSNIAPNHFKRINTVYKTFIPDFTPAFLLPLLTRVERVLENSALLRRFSAHISIIFEKI